MHKVIHLVVGTFEQGLETSPAPYIEKTEVTVSDWTLVSVGPAHPVRWSMKTLASVSDQTLGHLVIGRWRGAFGPADVVAHRGDTV